jgi:superfamily II DNA or RNA helicase
VQRQRGTQSLGRILRPDRFGDLVNVHAVSLG